MKKFIVLCLGILFLLSGVACSANKEATPSSSSSSYNTDQAKDEQQKQNDTTTKDADGQNNGNSAATGKTDSNTSPSKDPNTSTSNIPEKTQKNPIVTIEMEDGKKITIELYPKVAPNTVKNFISLVSKGFYDGLIFHRVIPNFMIQGGDPSGNGTGGPGYGIKGEFASNGFANDLKHERGVISMARATMPDSAGSQFFIMVAAAPSLDGEYAAFGKVLTGIEETDKIVSVERDPRDKPVMPQKIKKATVDTFGVKYEAPEVISK